MSMNISELKKLSKSQLTELLLKDQQKSKKPIPTPRKSVKKMVKDYEQNIIERPVEFRDKPVPKLRTIKSKPIPAPRTKITLLQQALKDAVQSYEVSIKFDKDPLAHDQLNNTALFIENYL